MSRPIKYCPYCGDQHIRYADDEVPSYAWCPTCKTWISAGEDFTIEEVIYNPEAQEHKEDGRNDEGGEGMTRYVFPSEIRKELAASMEVNNESRSYSLEIMEITILANIHQALREICEQLEGIKKRITSDVI